MTRNVPARGDTTTQNPAVSAVAVTLDADLAKNVKSLWIPGAGAIRVSFESATGSRVTISGIPAGTLLEIAPKHIFASGTTAAYSAGIIGLI